VTCIQISHQVFRRLLFCTAITAALSVPSILAAQVSLEIEALIQKTKVGTTRPKQENLSVSAIKRYAVVIGNSSYQHAPKLKNARADAGLVANFLRDQGYETHEYYDITKLKFEEILRRILFDVDKGSDVVFYYAGHGLQIGSKNYIVPVNADLNTAYDVPFETVSLQSLVSIVGSRARSQVVILDSCRDNPFGPKNVYTDISKTKQQSRVGFSVQTAPVNSLLAFSTSPGGIALDGEGENSPYTAAFVNIGSKHLELTIGGVLEEVRADLYKKTYGFQVSWESSTLIKPMYLNPKTVFDVASASSQPFSANTSTRSLALLNASLPKITTAVQNVIAGQFSLSAALEDEVEIGPALSEQLQQLPDVEMRLVDAPKSGFLAMSESGKQQLPLGYDYTSVSKMDNLIYVGNTSQIRAIDMGQSNVTDQFTLEGASGTQVVNIELQPNACDLEAGDYLDPDGVGLARYPNEIEPEMALAACRTAVANAPENGRFHYQLGRALLALRKNDQAKPAFERARDLGHTRAWYGLGDLAAHEASASGGRADKQAPELALALFGMGVKEGDPYAFYALGRELMRYETDIRRQREGFDLMMRALEVGHTFAMNELGYFYLDEKSAFYDGERGLRYLRESAAREDIYVYNNMGLVYQQGLGGTKPDFKLAYEWYLKAANGGHPNAPTNLGRMYFNGQVGGKADMRLAVEWYDKGLERGDAWAGANAAWLIANKSVKGYGNFDAAQRAAKAAVLRNPQAAKSADGVLAKLSKQALDGGAQQLLNALGASVVVDGAFGAGSVSALQKIANEIGISPPADTRGRIKFLAEQFWQQSKFRVDLY